MNYALNKSFYFCGKIAISLSAITRLHGSFTQSYLSSNIRTYAEPNSSNNFSTFPGTQRKTWQIKWDVLAQYMGIEGKIGEIKMQEFLQPSICLLCLKKGLKKTSDCVSFWL